ncbi:oxysterol-binding protein [Plakobranchus ocellatus]|uniref:Oxysterol-binding protein n=1 Tax=Plakobranchus ocellatus TaxID=259542 RepID=A0AAV3ZYZ8_9GAST|nr:oxysterol-binding protein [Plakobranchus ocellatus]
MHSVQARHVLFRVASSIKDGSEDDSASLASFNQTEGAGAAGGVAGNTGVTTPGPGGATNPASASGVGKAGISKKRASRKSRQEWDVVEGLKDGQRCEDKPERFQGYLMKRRKWPMKGWHKVQRGKYHGIMDIGLAVITFKKPGQRIDIDAEEQVHHIKV